MKSSGKATSAPSVREQAVDWVLRGEAGPLSDHDGEKLDAWLASDPAHRLEYERARLLFRDAGEALIADSDHTKKQLRAGRGKSIVAVAVVLVTLCAGFILADGFVFLRADIQSATNEIHLHRLPDGSTVHLNANTALLEAINDAGRNVTILTGEAYFEVTPDPLRPFIVKAGAGQVEVLGTAFNVNRSGGWTEVTVTENRVMVIGQGAEVILKPGERVSYDEDGRLSSVAQVPTEMEVPWRSGRLIFEDRQLPKVLEEIGRHIPGKFAVVGSARNRRISGTFDITSPKQALDGFVDAFGLRVIRAGPLLTLVY